MELLPQIRDQVRLGKELHLHADLAAHRGLQRGSARRGANRAVQQGGAQLVEEARGHAVALYQAHGAGVAVGQDGLGVARRDVAQARGNVVQGFVPAHFHKLAAALGTAALERFEQTLRVVGALGVARDLGAEYAPGLRVRRVAVHLDGHAVLHAGDQGAGVRAIVRAGALHFKVTDGGRGEG